ncbi:hypothetical protein [Phytohabitans houttuyneae]|uniref:Uncharacterized protein n=1 Tax=Phytohabitans houttuyneae TaxID=1076126 RepID=A0A6V8KAM9_9ACTN|nr:hypothetical protein [Phytohabitans houttuyneae]GFJ79438.1 hypothetical protein Phou_036180 [Phytohabitans houttuyneae]
MQTTATTTPCQVRSHARTLAAPHALAVRLGELSGNTHMAATGRRHLQRLADRFGYTAAQLLLAANRDADRAWPER